MVIDIHKRFCHAGVQFIMSEIRKKYWVLHARRTIRSILRKCVKCRRYDAVKTEVDAAALPEKRTTIGQPFQTTGVDLAGPLILRDGTKAWIVLYTCAVYRCVHFDIVTSLSTDAFLRSLERFIYTEGRPKNIFSDNGTNFVGAVSLMKKLKLEKLEEICANKINWTFNPPTASWWGGWWERLVRTTKDLLKRTVGAAKLTNDELRTYLAAASHTINARPLNAVTEDPEDLTPLTPDAFRRGLAMKGFPEAEEIKVTGRKLQERYKMLQHLKQQFQNRFRDEY